MYSLATRFLHLFPPETAHHLAITSLRYIPVKNVLEEIDLSAFSQTIMGLPFPHPLGLAAGFDKDAEVFDRLGHLGFSFVEIGSVTPKPQPGNPKPRLFRLPKQRALINRYGFNSKGLDYVIQQFQQHPRSCITGINLGKNKNSTDASADFIQGAQALAPFADYFTINVSSPNTPGLRDLQAPQELKPIISGIREVIQQQQRAIPLLVKISPDLSLEQESALVEFLIAEAVDGIIISNTTLKRDGVENEKIAAEGGGLSGEPLKSRSTAQLQRVYSLTRGKVVLIGCGGISSGLDAYDKLRAGANLLQLYTAFIYQGPYVLKRILLELKSLLERDGVGGVREIVGNTVPPHTPSPGPSGHPLP